MKNLLLTITLASLLVACSKSPTGPASQGPDDTPLTLTSTGSSQAGAIVRTPAQDTFALGDTVTIIAVPGAGYSFSGWSGDTTTTAASLTIVMHKNMTVYANFINNSTGKKVFSITTASVNGSINFSPAGGVYDSGSVVSVKAMPDYGMKFSSWSGLMTGTDSVAFLNITQNGTLRANFIIDPNAVFATLHVTPAPVNGKIVLSPPGIQSGNDYLFQPNTRVTIFQVPNSGYILDTWGGDLAMYSSSVASMDMIMDTDYTISPVFTKSPDGVVWTARTSGNGNGLLGVVGNGSDIIVVVGNMGTILTSPDGITWTARTSGVTSCLNCVIWTGAMFVCVGDDGVILTSADGKTWTQKNSSTTYGLESIVWTGSRFVAVGGQFVNSGLNYNCVVTSTDGNTWTSRNGGIGIWYGLAWNGSRLVSTGYDYDFTTVSDNSMSVMYTSADGTSWAPGGNDISQMTSLNSIVWSGSIFVAVGGSRDQTYPATSVYFSQNGDSWTEGNTQTQSMLNAVTRTPNNFVAVGDDGMVLTAGLSGSPMTWTSRYSGTTYPIYGVTWTGPSTGSGTGMLVAVGYGGMILTSP